MSKDPTRSLRALVDAGISLASDLDLDSLLQRVADLSREVLSARYAAVGVVADDGSLTRFIYSGIDRQTADTIGDLPIGRGILGVLIKEGRPLRLREIAEHPTSFGFPPNHPPMRSFLGLPIVVRNRTFGRLYLTEKIGDVEFSKDDERIGMTLAAQAGTAIENARLYDEIRTRTDELARRMAEMASIERVGGRVIASSVVEVIAAAAEECLKLTGALRSAILLKEQTTGDLVARAAAGDVSEGFVGLRLPRGKSKAEAVMHRMEAEYVPDLQQDPEMHPVAMDLLGRPSSGAFAPIAVHGRPLGVLAVYDMPSDRTRPSDYIPVLQMLANQIAIALENERLTEALRDLAVLEERERIAKELHDGVIQSIYSAGLALQASASMLERDPAKARSRIDGVLKELDSVVRDVRSYIFDLRPQVVEEHGLAAAIRELAREFEVNTLAHAMVELEARACDGLPVGHQHAVVQIVREILSNVARHAEATAVHLACRRRDGYLELEVSDDGKGFDPSAVKLGEGLRNMTQRATALGGFIDIMKRAPGGTLHRLRLPVQEGDA